MKNEFTIDAELMRNALGTSMRNPELQRIFKEAPQAAKPVLKLKFAAMVFPDQISDEAFGANLEELTKTLGADDLRYLIDTETDAGMKAYFENLLHEGSGAGPDKAAMSEEKNRVKCERVGKPTSGLSSEKGKKKRRILFVVIAVIGILALVGAIAFLTSCGGHFSDVSVPHDAAIAKAYLEKMIESGLPPKEDWCYYHPFESAVRVRAVLPDGRVVVWVDEDRRHSAVIFTEQECVDGGILTSGLYKFKGVERFKIGNDDQQTVYGYCRVKPKIWDEILEERTKEQEKHELELKKERQAEELKKKELEIARQKRQLAQEKVLAEERQKKEQELAEQKRQLAEMRRKQEAELAEKKRQMMIAEKEADEKAKAKAAAEAAAAYPKIQAERKAYASKVLTALDLRLSSFILVDPFVKRFIKGMKIEDRSWRDLETALAKQDWLNALCAMSGEQLKEFPDMDAVNAIVESFRKKEFTLMVKFHSKESYEKVTFEKNSSLSRVKLAYDGRIYYRSSDMIGSVDSSGVGRAEISLAHGPYLYYHYSSEDTSKDKLEKHRDSYEAACAKLERQIEKGEVSEEMGIKKRCELRRTYITGLMSRIGISAPMSVFSDLINGKRSEE